MKINKLEIENVKRVKAVKIEPSANGLTVIGGRNGQGKTSVLDALAWALGGERYRPSNPQNDSSVIPPSIRVILNNGLVVERKGKNSDLKVIDPTGQKSGQQLLNGFVEELAIDLPRFLHSTDKEKAETLLKIIGVGDQLAALEQQETEIYNNRRAIGQIADQKEKFAKEQVYYPDAPKEPVSASDLIMKQQDILAQNGENQRKRQNLALIESEATKLQQQLTELQDKIARNAVDLETARKSALDLVDESTEALEQSIRDIEDINRKVRTNLDKDKAEEDARYYTDKYAELTIDLDAVRHKKTDLLQSAHLPLPGLTVDEGVLKFNGFPWDSMSGSDRLKVATAIVRKLNPQCGFVLLDQLEQMDIQTLNEFGAWLEQEGLQAIATRVSTGGECSIIIEDGYVVGDEVTEADNTAPQANGWKEGTF
jgi:predicted ATP-dependent endonuclease of OLD family